MKRYYLAAVASLLIAIPALAAVDPPEAKHELVVTLTDAILSAAAINAACDSQVHLVATPACAYFKKKVLGYHQATIQVTYTKGAATDVYMVCERSIDGAVPWGVFDAGITGATYIDMKALPYRWDVSALAGGEGASWRVNLKLNDPWLRCRFWSTSGNANDKVTVQITLASP